MSDACGCTVRRTDPLEMRGASGAWSAVPKVSSNTPMPMLAFLRCAFAHGWPVAVMDPNDERLAVRGVTRGSADRTLDRLRGGMSPFEAWTLLIAGVSLILSSVTFYHWFLDRRVRLRLSCGPARVWSPETNRVLGWSFSVTVVNLSSFPIWISEVGYTEATGPGRFRFFLASDTGTHLLMPQKVEPRGRLHGFVGPTELLSMSSKEPFPKRLFARTECGVSVRGPRYRVALEQALSLGAIERDQVRGVLTPRQIERALRRRSTMR